MADERGDEYRAYNDSRRVESVRRTNAWIFLIAGPPRKESGDQHLSVIDDASRSGHTGNIDFEIERGSYRNESYEVPHLSDPEYSRSRSAFSSSGKANVYRNRYRQHVRQRRSFPNAYGAD